MEMKTSVITVVAVLLIAFILFIIAGSIIAPISELQKSVGEQIASEQVISEIN